MLIPSPSTKASRKRHFSGKSRSSNRDSDLVDGKMPSEEKHNGTVQSQPNHSSPVSNEGSSDSSITNDTISLRRKYVGVGVLFFINLLNYMDRFTIAGKIVATISSKIFIYKIIGCVT